MRRRNEFFNAVILYRNNAPHWFCLLCMIGIFNVASAQIVQRQVNLDSLQVVTFHFDRILNTFLWNGTLRAGFANDDWNVSLVQIGNSRLFRSTTNSLQDDYIGGITVERSISEWLSMTVRDTSQMLSTNQQLEFGSMSSHRLLGGVKLLPSNQWQMNLETGYEWNKQANIQDRGSTFSFLASNPMIEIEDFRSTLYANFDYSHLERRKPYDGGVQFSLSRRFNEELVDSMVVFLQTQKREFYTPPDQMLQELYATTTNILSRSIDARQFSNILEWEGEHIGWQFTAALSNRTIERSYRYKSFLSIQSATPLDTRIEELQMSLGAAAQWRLGQWNTTNLGFRYLEREENHAILSENQAPETIIEKQKEDAHRLANTSKRAELSLQSITMPTNADSISLELSYSLLRYDTPDTTNYNDRDELWFNIGVGYARRITPEFTTSICADVYLNHLVYLSKKQSANNNWNRVIRLEWENSFQPSEFFRTLLLTEVLANYTVSDYEKQVASVKSYAFRQFRLEDSTQWYFNQSVGLNFQGAVRLSERGILRWKEFSERPEQYYQEYTIMPRLFYVPSHSVQLQLGYRLFLQERYTYSGKVKVLDQILRSLGPTVLCVLQTPKYRLAIDGWYEHQYVQSRTVAKIPNLSVSTFFLL